LWKKPSIISDEIIKNTHDAKYVDLVKKSFPAKGFSSLDGDTIISPGSKEAIFDAAGSIIAAIDGIQNKEFKNAFASVRPPGHHCNQNKAAGFCILNNIAIGAKYLLNKYKYKKIAIIDFDVHHGNGTQDIFYENESVLFISTHQYPYYPGSGSEQEKGKFNNIYNIPLPAGTNSEEYFNAFDHALKRLREFKPEFVLISAGFDAHKDDPLAQIKLETEDFYNITKRILETSKKYCNGKIVSILEGGYDLQALKDSTKRHVDALIEFN
jgi:acetoin utilization deacetylase AcuC-like enzyme